MEMYASIDTRVKYFWNKLWILGCEKLSLFLTYFHPDFFFLLNKWEKMYTRYPTNASHYFGSWKSNSSFPMRIHQEHLFSTKNRYFFPTPFQFNYEVKLSSNNNFDACIIILSVRDILAH